MFLEVRGGVIGTGENVMFIVMMAGRSMALDMGVKTAVIGARVLHRMGVKFVALAFST